MLNRNIPMYEGALPYLYACFSPEDEMLVLPILARMYNEGFRFWSASLADKVSDFVAVRHVSTSSCVVMFMSHSMLERINSGMPEVLASCRSSLLRTVVLLDDARFDNRLFALTAPEQVEYQRSNDSSFWLYAYSADFLERCRGPWPEKKVEMREPVFEDVQQEVIAEEYINLENIITRGGTSPDQIASYQHPNNKGYIKPAPDSLIYAPLAKVDAAKTVHDRDFDAAIALIDECAEKQVNIIITHTRPGENTVPSKPSLSPIKPMPNKQAEMKMIWEELAQSADRPERKIDPEIRTKADMVVQPDERPEPAPIAETAQTVQPDTVSEEKPIVTLPEIDLSPRAIAAEIEQIAASAAGNYAPSQTGEEAAEEEDCTAAEPETIPECREEAACQPSVAESDTEEEGRCDAVARNNTETSGKSTVQVVVRRQQPAVRVTPVKKRVITEPVRTPAEESRSPKLARSPFGSRMRNLERYGSIEFEQYIRDIALSAVAAEQTEIEEAPVSHRRFGRSGSISTHAVDAAPVVSVRSVSVAEPAALAAVSSPAPAEPTAPAAEQTDTEKTSARKSRYPHNSRLLTGLLAALRQERAVSDNIAEPAAEEPVEEEKPAVITQDIDDVKVIRLSDAISERKVSDLQAAVNKFMRLDTPAEPASAPLVVRTYGIRR